MNRAFLFATLSLGALVACNLGPAKDLSTDDSGVSTDDSGTPSSGVSITDLQDGTIGEGETVTLKDVIVTSPITTAGDGFFIQDAGGGEMSGIYVFMQGGTDGLFIAPGDRIDVTGTTTEYYEWTEFAVSSPTAIEIAGVGEITVDTVDPSTADWETWESCVIAIGASTVTEGVNSYGEALLDNGLKLDNVFFNFDTETGATYTDVVGTLGYSYSEWKLFPRSPEDLKGYVEGAGPDPVTLSQIQQGEVSEGAQVKVEGVTVASGLTYKGDGFFVADPAGGLYSGIYVYVGDNYTGTLPAVGAVVDIEAGYVEYYDLSELTNPEITETGTGDPPTATVVSEKPADWEPYEGMLITLSNLEITSEIDEYGESTTSMGVKLDNLFFNYTANKGDVLEVTGFLTYNFESWKLAPRAESDLSVAD